MTKPTNAGNQTAAMRERVGDFIGGNVAGERPGPGEHNVSLRPRDGHSKAICHESFGRNVRERLKSRRAGRCGAHFRGIDPESKMREPGLAERHEAGIEVAPHEKQQERDRGVILIQDGVDHGESEV